MGTSVATNAHPPVHRYKQIKNDIGEKKVVKLVKNMIIYMFCVFLSSDLLAGIVICRMLPKHYFTKLKVIRGLINA